MPKNKNRRASENRSSRFHAVAGFCLLLLFSLLGAWLGYVRVNALRLHARDEFGWTHASPPHPAELRATSYQQKPLMPYADTTPSATPTPAPPTSCEAAKDVVRFPTLTQTPAAALREDSVAAALARAERDAASRRL